MARRKSNGGKTQAVKPPVRDVNAAVRALRALDLYIEGHGWQFVADSAGYASRGAAYNAVMRELDRQFDVRVDRLRKVHQMRLNRLRTVYLPRALDGEGWSADRVLAFDEREARLMGLDMTHDDTPAGPAQIKVIRRGGVSKPESVTDGAAS